MANKTEVAASRLFDAEIARKKELGKALYNMSLEDCQNLIHAIALEIEGTKRRLDEGDIDIDDLINIASAVEDILEDAGI